MADTWDPSQKYKDPQGNIWGFDGKQWAVTQSAPALTTEQQVKEGMEGFGRGVIRGAAEVPAIPAQVGRAGFKIANWATGANVPVPDFLETDYGQKIRDTASSATGVDLGESKGAGIPAEEVGKSVLPGMAVGAGKSAVDTAVAGIKYGAAPTAVGMGAQKLAEGSNIDFVRENADIARMVAEIATGGVAATMRNPSRGAAPAAALRGADAAAYKEIGGMTKMSPQGQRTLAAQILANPNARAQFRPEEQAILKKISDGDATDWVLKQLEKVGFDSPIGKLATGIGLTSTGSLPSWLTAPMAGAPLTIDATITAARNRMVRNKVKTLDSIIRGGTNPAQGSRARGAAGSVVEGVNETDNPTEEQPLQ